MISVSLAYDSDGRLIPGYIPRRPDETLHDYLLRSRNELALHIRMLEATSDAQTELFGSQRRHWRRAMVMLAFGEAGIAAAAYLLLHLSGLSGSVSALCLAAMIGSCALVGAAVSVGIATLLGRITSWRLAADDLVRRLLRRPRLVAEPSATILPLIRTRDGESEAAAMQHSPASEGKPCKVDPDLEIEAVIEDCAISRLDMWTSLWSIGLLAFEALVATIGLSALRAAFGVPLDIVFSDAPLILGVCLVFGLFVLPFANLAGNGLERLAIWWRRR
ncbi:hypothetical protein [Sphingobium sp. R-7]|uniref:hypothetical protein n=1 Tax=Sphingobium sp. R-7 TaxID=3375449 RepID=UPI00398B9EEF